MSMERVWSGQRRAPLPARRRLGGPSDISDRLFHSTTSGASRRWAAELGLPTYVVELVLLIEDKRFPIHLGVDPLAVVRSALRNATRRAVAEGASTLVQQLYDVRRESAGQERLRTWRRKLGQAAWAI